MVVAVNPIPSNKEFQTLLDGTLNALSLEANKNPAKYLSLNGNKLEDTVAEIMQENAIGTEFEGSIELISGQRFPDIIAKKYYGVEVKTTKANHWKSTGSSVAEGTRVEGIERIFMLFGKMYSPIEFKCRPYEDCLSEVVVTHSPRYLIDMNLKPGETIFDKIKVPYDELRLQENPINTVLNYYREHKKAGENIWWLNQPSNLIMKGWSNLSTKEQQLYRISGYCLFPEIVSNKSDKFNRYAFWLSSREGVICPNIRDIFTAGGQGSYMFNGKTYFNIPKVLIRLLANIDLIKEALTNKYSCDILSEFWEYKTSEKKKIENWINLIVANSAGLKITKFPLQEILTTMML